MPMPSRSGEVKSSAASECDSRVPDATFSPTALRSRSPILPRSSEIPGFMCSALVALYGKGGVVANEAEAVAEDGVDLAFEGGIGGVVEVELGIGMTVSDSRRNASLAHHKGADDCLDGSRCSEHVTRRGFCRADVHVLRVVAEDRLDGARLVEVIGGCR